MFATFSKLALTSTSTALHSRCLRPQALPHCTVVVTVVGAALSDSCSHRIPDLQVSLYSARDPHKRAKAARTQPETSLPQMAIFLLINNYCIDALQEIDPPL